MRRTDASRRLPPDSADPFQNAPAPTIEDPGAVRAMLVAAARSRRVMTYAQALERLGHRFSRPKMRQLCRVLAQVDTMAHEAGEPELAVLVVRASDGLPGEGWWDGRAPDAKLVQKQQQAAFTYWSSYGQ